MVSLHRTPAHRPGVATSGPVPLPVLRTLGTPVIRWTVAILLFVGGWLAVSQMLIGHATSADGNFGLDFADYHVAAQRLTATGTPYAPEMLDGPIGAIGRDRYRYPPPLAQLLAPLNSLSHRDAASVWLGLQGLAIVGAVFIALRTGGARRGPEAVLWVGVAVAWFLPAYDTLWEGNVSGFLALAVALAATGGRTGAVAAVLATFLKVAPVLLLPAVTGTRRALITAIVTTAAILGVSAVLVPGAWADYLVVLPHMLVGSALDPNNLAPAAMAENLWGPGVASTLLRLAALALAAACTLESIRLGRRPDGVPAAVVLGTAAMLLLPAVLWFHYLVALLPLAAMAWPHASRALRATLLTGATLISLGMLIGFPLATAGAVIVVAAAARGVWPAAAVDRPVAPHRWSTGRLHPHGAR